MRLLAILLLSATLVPRAARDCHVDCPKNSHGGCIKYEDNFYCRCLVNANDLKEDLLNHLEGLGASRDLLANVRKYIDSKKNEISAQKTFTDPKTGKEFTVLLKRAVLE